MLQTMEKTTRRNQFFRSVVLFFMFCVMGWCWEFMLGRIFENAWQNPGFLHGPWLPIYGVGVLSMAAVWHAIRKKFPRPLPHWLTAVSMFLLAGSLATALEWVTSLAAEHFFGLKLWDYSQYPWNLDGRICLYAWTLFGFGGILTVFFLLPRFSKWLDRLRPVAEIRLGVAILVIMGIDLIYTLWSL
ncbi:MAG: putative ABC transporter permease [Oscillospiraceae bacterium]|nr:putative ABC transporter permease [Oscillospiraceae bacterium]